MFFKNFHFFRIPAVAVVFSSLLVSGCGLKVGESPAPEGEVRMDGYSCVNQISQKVGDYFENELDESEIILFVDCLKKSVSDFTKRVGRRDTQYFSPEDLRAFINRIAAGRELNQNLLFQFMKIKQTFVGGRVDQISRADLAAALNLLEDIKKAAIILRPHVKMLNSDLGHQIPPEEIAKELDLASEALSDISRIFVGSLKSSERAYSLKDFEAFLEEFRHFINWYGVFPDGRAAKEWIELIASVKEISTGGDRYQIEKGEWESFLSVGRSAYIASLKIKYGISGQNIWSEVGLKNLVHVFDQVRDEVIRLISARKNRLIPKEEVKRLLSSLETLGWLPFGLNAEVSTLGMELVATKILDRGSQGEFLGFRVSHVLKLANEFETWASTQKYITTSVAGPNPSIFSGATPQVFTSAGVAAEDLLVRRSSDFIPTGWNEFQKFLQGRRPLFGAQSTQITLDYASSLKARGVEFDLHNLSLTHLYYRVLRLIYESYGRSPEGKGDYFLSGPSLQQFYVDFTPIGVGLGWLDSRSRTAGSRSYVEGNLFTYAANGMVDEYDLSLSEGVDLIGYLFTAGKLTDQLYLDLKICEAGLPDFRGEPKILRSCVTQKLALLLDRRLDFAPRLQSWLRSLPEEEKERYSNLLLRAAFSDANSDPDWVEKSELSTLSVVMLYSESVMTRFDENQDGVLSDDEADMAFPIFKDFINRLAMSLTGQDEAYSENRVIAIYEFILHFKRAPEGKMDMISIAWQGSGSPPCLEWATSPEIACVRVKDTIEPGWVVESDRMDLTETFSVIINRLLNVVPPARVSTPNQDL